MKTIISSEGIDQEILSCLQVLYATPAGTVPCDRDYGIDHSLQDLPINISRVKLIAEYTMKTKKYEPRATVQQVTMDADAEGTLNVKVVVR